MRPIVTVVARSVVCMYVCVLTTRVSCAKTAESIEMLFVELIRVRPVNRVLDGVQIPHDTCLFLDLI